MYDQPRYDVQEESAFFPDHRTMRPLVEGVIAHDQDVDPQIAQGRLDDESGYVLEIPKQVVARSGGMQAMLERGKQRFGIYCAPCHDNTGSGEGLVKRRAVASGAAAFVPPTFHQDRIRHMPDGQLFATISNGKSNMPPYAMQIKVDDRWSIVAYVRALQMAQPKMSGLAAPAPTAVPGGTSLPAPGGSHAPPATSEAPAGSSSAATTPTGAASATGPTGSASATAPATSGAAKPATAPASSGAAKPASSAHPQENKP
jgi:mono/diheme cytochrome c family protein